MSNFSSLIFIEQWILQRSNSTLPAGKYEITNFRFGAGVAIGYVYVDMSRSNPRHDRFSVVTEIMRKIVSSAPDSVTIDQLEELTGRPAQDIAGLCACLSPAGLL